MNKDKLSIEAKQLPNKKRDKSKIRQTNILTIRQTINRQKDAYTGKKVVRLPDNKQFNALINEYDD